MSKTLRLVMGDQLSDGLSALRDLDPACDVVLMAEVRRESTFVGYHKQKLALVYAGMRHFAERLRARGVRVRYVRLDDPDNTQDLESELARALAADAFDRVALTECGRWDLQQTLLTLHERLGLPVEVREDDRFICSHREFSAWATGKGSLRMEFFYREMRRKTGLLMDGKQPTGGRWNFDAENRKRLPKGAVLPPRFAPEPDAVTDGALADVARWFPDNFGALAPFEYATSHAQAERVLDHFITRCLANFGDFQDFMLTGQPWMWHAHISAAMNLGLIDPLDACRRAEAEYRAGRAPLNAVEGFIRQVIGWREYVRGIYWLKMPEYKLRNALSADRALPWFYWTAETDMACMKDVVEVTRDHAYAHHIQRLMVAGNLAMLLGVAPPEINEWYMVVYADAYEWVELPNTHGMATFADGGIMGSKPYAASGAYIDRMSDYCRGCRYDVRERLGEDACPFNALYWDFLIRNRGVLGANPRMGVMYGTIDKMGPDLRAQITEKAQSTKRAFGAVPAGEVVQPDAAGPGGGPPPPSVPAL